MDGIARPYITPARPVGADCVMDGAEPFAVIKRAEIGAGAIGLLGQIVDRTAAAIAATAAGAGAQPRQFIWLRLLTPARAP